MGLKSIFAKDTNGYIVTLNNVSIESFPPSQGVTHSFLHDDGQGNWTWEQIHFSYIVGEAHEVVMETGIAPPSPVLNSTGDDWIYSS